jgi:carbonic anhydrase
MKIVLLVIALSFGSGLALASGEDPHWEYEGEEGPSHWGELAAEFDMCQRGKNQSPVDLVSDFDADMSTVKFDYTHPGQLQEVNTGHAIQENVQPGNFVSILDHQFELKQFHFHSPSEHTVNGAHYPMEVHFVHQDENGNLLVVGLMFVEGEHNAMMDDLPSFRKKRGLEPLEQPFDYNRFITDRDDYYLYNGSLTTPPCSEGVQWIVLTTPIEVSSKQIQHFHDLLGFDNNRPIQPKNARIILE